MFLRGALAASLPALLIGGWWFVRNWVLYRDLLAWNMWQANILRRIVPAGWSTIASELGSLERSFWGLFGWLNVPYPEWVYTVFRLGEIFMVLGLALSLVLVLRRARADWRWGAAGAVLLWLVLLSVSWLRFMQEVPAAQGRYFYPALTALALFVALSWRGWLTLFPRGSRVIRTAMWLPTAALALLAVVTPFWIIAPAYAAPASREDLRTALTPLRAELGGEFAITGVAAQGGTLRPGDTAEVIVAWEALHASDADYSVFVHLNGEAGLPVAQLDTMPGGGNRPTSQWLPGETRVETYRVRIPATAYAPDSGRWMVGMYNAWTGERLPLRLTSPAAGVTSEESALVFGSLRLVRDEGAIPNAVGIELTDNVTLEGYEISARVLRPGDRVTVTVYWRARGAVSRPYTSFAHLLDRDYGTRGGHDAPPQPPTDAWAPGELITDVHAFEVAPDAAAGVYQIEVGLYTQPEMARLPLVTGPGAEGADRVLLGPLRVVAR